jgi:hypothetical protein
MVSALGSSARSVSARITSRHHSPTFRPRASASFSISAYSFSVTLAPAERVRKSGIVVTPAVSLDERAGKPVLAKSTSYRTVTLQRCTALQKCDFSRNSHSLNTLTFVNFPALCSTLPRGDVSQRKADAEGSANSHPPESSLGNTKKSPLGRPGSPHSRPAPGRGSAA